MKTATKAASVDSRQIRQNGFYFIDSIESFILTRSNGKSRFMRRLHCTIKLMLLRMMKL